MKNNSPAKVIFFRVKDNAAKIQIICNQAQAAFQREKKLLITVPSLQGAQYIDSLLWRASEESFLPHAIADIPTFEWIVITTQELQNVNQAAWLLNLCPNGSPLYDNVEEIFELYDETDPQKLELSRQRQRFYQGKNLQVIT